MKISNIQTAMAEIDKMKREIDALIKEAEENDEPDYNKHLEVISEFNDKLNKIEALYKIHNN